MRLLDLFESAAPILRGVLPRIWRGADEGSRRRAVAEVDPLHGDDLIDNARQLAPGLSAFELWLPGRDVEIVCESFQDCDEDDVLAARVLSLLQPRDQLTTE
jgi:hypothetical protein